MVIVRLRSPALMTTSAVITLVMLPIGRSVFASRLHRTVPVDASARAAALACTPLGALDLAVAALACLTAWARLGGAVTARARAAARADPAASRAVRSIRGVRGARRPRVAMGTPGGIRSHELPGDSGQPFRSGISWQTRRA